MDAWRLSIGSDLGLMSLATTVLVIVIGFCMVRFYGKMVEEYVRKVK